MFLTSLNRDSDACSKIIIVKMGFYDDIEPFEVSRAQLYQIHRKCWIEVFNVAFDKGLKLSGFSVLNSAVWPDPPRKGLYEVKTISAAVRVNRLGCEIYPWDGTTKLTVQMDGVAESVCTFHESAGTCCEAPEPRPILLNSLITQITVVELQFHSRAILSNSDVLIPKLKDKTGGGRVIFDDLKRLFPQPRTWVELIEYVKAQLKERRNMILAHTKVLRDQIESIEARLGWDEKPLPEIEAAIADLDGVKYP